MKCGCDLVEVTAHAGARPEHQLWQGKVYSRSGTSKKYPGLKEATGYGTGPGLGGWNCRHSFFPYFEDISERAYTDKELEELKTDNKNDIILTDNERQSINKYISSDSYKINEKLRSNIDLDDNDKLFISNLDKALNKMPNYNGNIVRVLDMKDKNKLDDFINSLEIGKQKTFNEYLSFSNRKGYNDKSNIEIYTISKNAKDITAFNKEESEILYKRNSKFNVIDKKYINKKYYIYLEESYE